MGGAIQYVYRDGSRLTPWMLYCVNRFSEAMYSAFGERILVTSGIRTYEEQKRIFLMRYVRHGDIRGRKVYDTRWWNGYLWYRIDPVGTVRQPRLSNHEIQGTTAAVDLRDTGKDAGISKFNNPRSNWARANAWRYGLSPEGYNFKEPWHFSIADIFRTPPATPAGGNSRPVPEEIKPLHLEDQMYAIRQVGLPDSGIIIRAGVPPYSMPQQIFETEASTYGLAIKELPDWRYGTAVREQWTAVNVLRNALQSPVSSEDVQRIATATREEIGKALNN